MPDKTRMPGRYQNLTFSGFDGQIQSDHLSDLLAPNPGSADHCGSGYLYFLSDYGADPLVALRLALDVQDFAASVNGYALLLSGSKHRQGCPAGIDLEIVREQEPACQIGSKLRFQALKRLRVEHLGALPALPDHFRFF